jgi:tetratricopeptide (TPR) repeat protein
MKKSFALAVVTALALCATQVCQAQGSKNANAKEANKLAREGVEASKNQEWDKAVDLLRKATALDHKYADELGAVYQQRGYAAANEKRFQDAINEYGEALKLTPQDPRIYEQRAAVEMKINDYDKALADYSEAIKLKPNETRYYLYRSYIYETKGDIKNSMADTEKVLKIDPKNQEALSRKARLEARQSANTPLPPPPPRSSPPKTSPAPAHRP